MYSVYTLADPRDNLIRYVGMSKQPVQRFAQHLLGNDQNDEKTAWIRELMQDDLMPTLTIIEKVETWEEANKREMQWIRYYIEVGMPLTNLAIGHLHMVKRKRKIEAVQSQLNLRYWRERRKFTVLELSEKSRVATKTISDIECHGLMPRHKTIERLAVALKGRIMS
jgi:predicted GIY-YIG superfamily endonuclease